MKFCHHLEDCEFVLHHVSKVKPHWDDFVNLYCRGDLQDMCKRREWFSEHNSTPSPDLMPTGKRVPELIMG